MKPKLATTIVMIFITALAGRLFASEIYKPPPESIKPPRVAIESIYSQKCSRCHPLSRPDETTKSPGQWKDTVIRMQRKDPNWITSEEAEKISSWLAGRNLHGAKCGKCHDLSRTKVQKTIPQWNTTVERMQSKDPSWISGKEAELIVFYLTDVDLLELD